MSKSILLGLGRKAARNEIDLADGEMIATLRHRLSGARGRLVLMPSWVASELTEFLDRTMLLKARWLNRMANAC